MQMIAKGCNYNFDCKKCKQLTNLLKESQLDVFFCFFLKRKSHKLTVFISNMHKVIQILSTRLQVQYKS